MANDFNSVLATCQRFQDIATWDAEHFNANDALARIAELHKREIAAKDVEIVRRDALINELAKGLNTFDMCHSRCDACKYADIVGFNCPQKMVRALVAKAREVISKAETTTGAASENEAPVQISHHRIS